MPLVLNLFAYIRRIVDVLAVLCRLLACNHNIMSGHFWNTPHQFELYRLPPTNLNIVVPGTDTRSCIHSTKLQSLSAWQSGNQNHGAAKFVRGAAVTTDVSTNGEHYVYSSSLRFHPPHTDIMSESKEGHTNNTEREVTDPITHLPLTIHDADSVELEQIPPPLSTADELKEREKRGADTKEDTNARHSDMEAVVREATQGTWIEDPIGDQRRTRIQTSIAAAGAATVGAFGALLMWTAFEKVKGHTTSLGWFGFFLAPFACMMLGLGVGAAGLLLGVIQHEAKPKPSKPHHDSEDARVSGYLTTYDLISFLCAGKDAQQIRISS